MSEKKKNVLPIVALIVCVAAVITIIVTEILKATVFGGHFSVTGNLVSGIVERLLLAAACVLLILVYGYGATFRPGLGKGLLPTLGGFAVALANFPFFTLASGELEIVESGGVVTLFVFHCLFIGLFEEIAFRGFVFPLLLDKLRDKRHGAALAVISSSGIFALVHLLNLFSGAPFGATALQIGYTFLVGCMCNVILIATKSLLFPILIHAAFDVGGTIVSLGVAKGSNWSAPSIVVMAVVGTLVGAYMIYYFFRHERDAIELIEKPTASEHNE